MYLLLVIIVWILFAYKFVDWSKVKLQYPTILFFIVVNMTYNMIYYQHTLWAFRGVTIDWLNHTIINLAFTFFICPVALTIYLQRFPHHRRIKYAYIAIWVMFFSILEYLFAHKGMFVYDNGWNGWHNVWFNLVLFIILTIHYRKPVIAIALSILVSCIFFLVFPVPISSLK
ncbi:CBO0543 family protein [Bacillus sp. CGMCC 1.16541]|uniref:CBO0543 family protein n=1 Tax=Bacillus sp. CGMCC 1.16541 TaxID=2185143 RepID=UPI000D73971A|nr:CBO0543 family protein [Bacillus sp. CGMCC 1.16541]